MINFSSLTRSSDDSYAYITKKLILFPKFSVPLGRENHIRLGVRLGSVSAAGDSILSVCFLFDFID
jgi:hypothetical protein